jgi:VanZ family protein
MSSRPDYGPYRELDSWLGALNFVARKIAHLLEYAVLFVLIHGAVQKTRPDFWRWHFLLSFVLVVLYAAGDEWHQSFVFGRTGTIRDVFIDSLGAMIGFYYDLRNAKKQKARHQGAPDLEDQTRHQS